MNSERRLLSGNEAIALAARDAAVMLGCGYPGTPSTEILEAFALLGGRGEWAPNEKVALEVAAGFSIGGGRSLCAMKHVGVNVAADALFTLAYAGVRGGLVLVSADDPGMHSSQNEQDNRHYAVAAGVPMLEPADSQECYDFLFTAYEISERWGIPVLFRVTTRVCHGKSIVNRRPGNPGEVRSSEFVRAIQERVMVPAHARPAHRRLRQKLTEISEWNETFDGNTECGTGPLGIITSGIAAMHAMEAAPDARFLKLGLTHPLPMERIRRFRETVQRCWAIEEGDPWLADAIRAEGIAVEAKPAMYRFGELNVERVKKILAGDVSPESQPRRGKTPQLCPSCPYHTVFSAFRKLDCIVAGDIGCYTLGALPPHEAMDAQLCMGASLGLGLGLRHALSEDQARRVVSVIGDSTFIHSGLTGLAEMVYNPPKTGHVLVILDNGTTAMTGRQEHPGTGRTLTHAMTGKVDIDKVILAMGVDHLDVIDPIVNPEGFETLLRSRLEEGKLSVIISRRPCLLAAGKIREYEKQAVPPAACPACGDSNREAGHV